MFYFNYNAHINIWGQACFIWDCLGNISVHLAEVTIGCCALSRVAPGKKISTWAKCALARCVLGGIFCISWTRKRHNKLPVCPGNFIPIFVSFYEILPSESRLHWERPTSSIIKKKTNPTKPQDGHLWRLSKQKDMTPCQCFSGK